MTSSSVKKKKKKKSLPHTKKKKKKRISWTDVTIRLHDMFYKQDLMANQKATVSFS